MRKVKYRVMMAAIALLAAGHAFAATPKTDSTIAHDQITLGDVFDGVTDHADYVLAPAPAMGKSVTLNAADLTRISTAFNLGWAPANNFEQVVIRRAASSIDRFDIQAALQKKLAEEVKGKKFETELQDRTLGFNVPGNADKTINVEQLSYDVAKGTFKAVVAAAAAPDVKKEVKGKLYAIAQVPVLNAPFRQGDVISAADVDMIEMREADISQSTIVDAHKLIGQTPRHAITALKPVMTADIQSPLMVKKGETVTMVLKSNIMSLTAQGKALENGAAGDVVHVMNTSSKQVVDAVVTGAQVVTIKAPGSVL